MNKQVQRGRPKGADREEKARQLLLSAAHALLKSKSYSDISIRELAVKAKLNSAMISYYFGSKEGLFLEMVERSAANKTFAELELIAEDQSIAAEKKLRRIIEAFVALHQDHPWLSRLIIDQVILKKGKLRDLFIKKIVTRNEKLVTQLIEEFVDSGFFRADLDLNHIRISLISLMAFPFLASPMLDAALGFNIYKVDQKEWVDHIFSLFLQGCKNH